MRAALWLAAAATLLCPTCAAAKSVESFQVAVGSEVLAEGANVHYLENITWLQKPWTSFNRSTHTLYAGVETLVEPVQRADGRERFGFDVVSVIAGYKLRTYLPDWFNFNVRVRVPLLAPRDPFRRPTCPAGVSSDDCIEERGTFDRWQLRVDPVLYQRTWNWFAVYDRNRITVTRENVEYGNKLKLIDLVPDLDFPIAMYAGADLRLRRQHDGGAFRARNDFLVGLASNFTDWLHLAVDLKYRLDSRSGAGNVLLAEAYLELYFDVFFDNTFGGAERRRRSAHTDARD